MPVLGINASDSARATLAALVDATEVLGARLEALELLVNELIGLFQAPLTQEERKARIRQITQQLRGPGLLTSEAGPDPQPDQEVADHG